MIRNEAPTTSIRIRTMRVLMTTTLVALLLSACALLVYELQAYRATWVQDLQTQADLVAQASTSALVFNDPRVANENLAFLRLRPQIEAAALYDAAGRRFAAYTARSQEPLPAALEAPGAPPNMGSRQLVLQQGIVHQGENLGTMVMRAQYDVLKRLLDYLAILGLITLVSLVLAWLVASRLQHAITDPILAISSVAREVVQQRNFALRARKVHHDEVGTLVDAFNDMLEELGAQAHALQTADRRKDEFLATLAHELRNPLAPVSTALSILARDTTASATQAHLVSVMKRQVSELVRLIDDLMEVSRISTGRMTLRMERVDLVDVVRVAVENAMPTMVERGHRLHVHWPEPVWVEGDRTRLGQIFTNLLGNAAKYTPPKGRIDLRFRLLPQAVRVSVADNGIGIAPDMQAEVFEMFVQADRSLARGRSSLGVGLSLARQLATLQGGSVTLHSAGLGHGATFTVELPRQADPSPVPTPAATPASPDPTPLAATGLSVLLADDNRDFTDSLALLLEQAGHRVRTAYNGHAALDAVHQHMPDAGLFDIGMPGLDGYGLATEVRAQPQGRHCLLVAITGWGQQTDRDRAHTAGFDDHLVKPVDPEAVLRLLATHAARRP
jgi:two-component system, sensor histidine kinase